MVWVNLLFCCAWSFLLQPSLCAIAEVLFCDRKVDELDKAIAVASRDPSWYGIDEVELESRRRWTSSARTQVSIMYSKFS